jgi:adenine-specific DNA methylase
MHKWWARRLGSVFRAISLYTLVDDPDNVEVYEPGENSQLSNFSSESTDIANLLKDISLEDSDSLWNIYAKDVRIKDKKILDPFMGGGTSIVEASRFGAECHGRDLNPVAWFITKKELDTGSTDAEKLESVYNRIKNSVAKQLKSYYKTPCPNHPGDHDADVMNSLWVKQVDCTSCDNTVSLFSDYRVAKGRYENDDKYNVFCPSCESIVLIDDWRSESTCSECDHSFVPQEGTVSGSKYTCGDCGQKYAITDAIQEQNGYELKYYAIEYHCPICDEKGYGKSEVKGYRSTREEDIQLFEESKAEWNRKNHLHQYVPKEDIPEGHMTSVRNPIFDHGYEKWSDMFNERQMLCLATLLKEIDEVKDKNAREFLLLTFTDFLCRNSMMCAYSQTANQVNHLFKTNAFDPPTRPTESNVWGAEYGTGTFESTWKKVVRGVKWGNAPTDRYIEYPDEEEYPRYPRNSSLSSPETIETEPFSYPVGQNTKIEQGDVRNIEAENEYDVIITDPPYYDNIIYSEISDYFYVWQKILLEEEYDGFKGSRTPNEESIVANPFLNKGEEDFEKELKQAFSVLRTAVKEDGVLTFTYHHSNSESWGELLESICDSGFEVTSTYPLTADVSKFIGGEAVSFDILVVARPTGDRQPISWNSLRRNIYRTAQKTREQIEGTRDLSEGDIGVIEMGECFHEYSKHHGEVQRAGETMTAKEVVQEIYGIIQEGSDIGEVDVFLDLLETPNATYNDLNKLTRGTDASPEQMKDMRLYRMESGELILGTWDDEKRMAYIQDRVNGDDQALNALDKAQFLRYRYEQGKSTQNYLSKWDVDDELRELCEGLADATGDDTYRRILGTDSTLGDF